MGSWGRWEGQAIPHALHALAVCTAISRGDPNSPAPTAFCPHRSIAARRQPFFLAATERFWGGSLPSPCVGAGLGRVSLLGALFRLATIFCPFLLLLSVVLERRKRQGPKLVGSAAASNERAGELLKVARTPSQTLGVGSFCICSHS